MDEIVKKLRDGEYTMIMPNGDIAYVNHAAADYIEGLLDQVTFFQNQYVHKTDIELQLRRLLKECEEAKCPSE